MLLISEVCCRAPRVFVEHVNDIIAAPARRQRISFRLPRTRERNAALDPRSLGRDSLRLVELIERIFLRLLQRGAVSLLQLRVPLDEVVLELDELWRRLLRREHSLYIVCNNMQREVCRIRATRTKPGGVTHLEARVVILRNNPRQILIADLIVGFAEFWRGRRANA